MIDSDVYGLGGTEKIWPTIQLAARVHNGRHTNAAKERDGSSTQP